MYKFITTPDCSNFSTVKLFAGMLDELKGRMENFEYQYFLDNVLQLKKKEINQFKFSNQHFRILIDFYLKSKASANENFFQEEVRLIN